MPYEAVTWMMFWSEFVSKPHVGKTDYVRLYDSIYACFYVQKTITNVVSKECG